MDIKPAYRIIANKKDITETIRKRLRSLRLVDEAGLQSDTLSLVLADHMSEKPLRVPETGAELEVFLGYDEKSVKMGLYIVDEVEISGPPGKMTVSARAQPQVDTPAGKTMLQTQKSRSFDSGLTLQDLVARISNDHNLEPAVAANLADIELPHIDQVNESDMHLLTRIARNYDAIAKPAGGKLIVARRGKSKSTSGKDMSTVELKPQQVTRWRVTIAKRIPAGSVVATWRDKDQAKDVEEVVGQGEPVYRLRHTYTGPEEAKKAAQAEMDNRARGEKSLSLTLPGRNDLVAETPVSMTGFRAGVDGSWVVERAEHQMGSGGYTVSVTCKLPEA